MGNSVKDHTLNWGSSQSVLSRSRRSQLIHHRRSRTRRRSAWRDVSDLRLTLSYRKGKLTQLSLWWPKRRWRIGSLGLTIHFMTHRTLFRLMSTRMGHPFSNEAITALRRCPSTPRPRRSSKPHSQAVFQLRKRFSRPLVGFWPQQSSQRTVQPRPPKTWMSKLTFLSRTRKIKIVIHRSLCLISRNRRANRPATIWAPKHSCPSWMKPIPTA